MADDRDLADTITMLIDGCNARRVLYTGSDFAAVKTAIETRWSGVTVFPYKPGAAPEPVDGVILTELVERQPAGAIPSLLKDFHARLPQRGKSGKSFILLDVYATKGMRLLRSGAAATIVTVQPTEWWDNILGLFERPRLLQFIRQNHG